MSLRLKLTLAFLAVASLLMLVGITSYVTQHRIHDQVAGLRSSQGLDLRFIELGEVGLEIEGLWDAKGIFVSRDVEILPGRRRPKLRGGIQRIDPASRAIEIFGVPILVTGDTEFASGLGGAADFESLRVAARVEVSCEVRDGEWFARKIRTEGVKESDKIKGTVTSWDLDGEGPGSLEMHGLVIALAPTAQATGGSAMRRIELAIQMTAALQECRVAAHELVGRRRGTDRLPLDFDADLDTRLPVGPAERMLRAVEDFSQFLTESRAPRAIGGPLESVLALESIPLEEGRAALDRQVVELLRLSATDEVAARRFLDASLDPLLTDELVPLVSAYLSDAEELLGDELRSIYAQSATTTWVALSTSAVASLVAIILGISLWRTISRPLKLLEAAAEEIGRGRFDARVAFESHDELGVLAAAFNRMAQELAGSTLSLANLESVVDSMAGALIIVDPEGRIVSVNRAALDLLGYERDELVGGPFANICLPSADAADGESGRASGAAIGVLEERVFVRSDGQRIPVSFSAAELRSGDGPTVGLVCVAQDLTERKRIEEQVRRSLDEKQLLLQEVHHRVKNNMQIISSLLDLQAGQLSDPAALETFRQSQNRIRSMALIHEQLYQSDDIATIDLGAYLHSLTSQLHQSFGHPTGVEIELDVESGVDLDIDRAISCGLIVNELVTNALKHAFPPGAIGRIRVSLASAAKGECSLRVSDTGAGGDVLGESVPGDGLGLRLVRTLAKQLGGQVTVDGSRGCEVNVVFPASPGGRG